MPLPREFRRAPFFANEFSDLKKFNLRLHTRRSILFTILKQQGGRAMNRVMIPQGYTPPLNTFDTQLAIEFIKHNFQVELS